jgi:hypothetical protein
MRRCVHGFDALVLSGTLIPFERMLKYMCASLTDTHDDDQSDADVQLLMGDLNAEPHEESVCLLRNGDVRLLWCVYVLMVCVRFLAFTDVFESCFGPNDATNKVCLS